MSGPCDRCMCIYVCVIARSPISKTPKSQSSMASFDYNGQLGGGVWVCGGSLLLWVVLCCLFLDCSELLVLLLVLLSAVGVLVISCYNLVESNRNNQKGLSGNI